MTEYNIYVGLNDQIKNEQLFGTYSLKNASRNEIKQVERGR